MSYLLRLALLSGAAFFTLYLCSSLAIAALWPLLRKRVHSWSATVIYSLRIFPFTFAATVVAVFVVPSFLGLEPFGSGEAFELPGLALALAGLATLIAGTATALVAAWKTSRFIAACTRNLPVANGTPAVEISTSQPVILVAGACRPRLLISAELTALLDADELHAAIQHELAHVSRHDNLKKLFLCFVRFPFLRGLENSWIQAAELAADDHVAISETAALDLASALVKVASRPQSSVPALAMSMVPDAEHALRIRVERLLHWTPRSAPRRVRLATWTLAATSFAVLTLAYVPLLHRVHDLCELLFH